MAAPQVFGPFPDSSSHGRLDWLSLSDCTSPIGNAAEQLNLQPQVTGIGWILYRITQVIKDNNTERGRADPASVNRYRMASEQEGDFDPPRSRRRATVNNPTVDSAQPRGNVEGSVPERLDAIFAGMVQFRSDLNRSQQETNAQLQSLQIELRQLQEKTQTSGSGPDPFSAEEACKKDPAANYLRRCIRIHVAQTFGFGDSKVVPAPPDDVQRADVLAYVARQRAIPKPYLYDWGDTPLALYNVCVEEAFCGDFWRKKWKEQESPLAPEAIIYRKKRSSRNSRIGTTYRNRRDAAAHIPIPDLAARVYNIVAEIGRGGISSDEEVQLPFGDPGGRRYATFDKPWRPEALVHLYRHLDLIHAVTRNPNGNPIRRRIRTQRVHADLTVPKGLPIDCYNQLYMHSRPSLERFTLKPKPRSGNRTRLRRPWLVGTRQTYTFNDLDGSVVLEEKAYMISEYSDDDVV
ncbi:hypothetical protein BV20DRAFT_982669 [Pilatotrama ljubarskyi]|nr:hypothetical protein BV20DRAFT_982669 [Pilatotrama ljubarskyi]